MSEKTFEHWVKVTRSQPAGIGWRIAVERALEALAAEREAERERARQAPQWTKAEINRLAPFVKAQPRSYSHWGMW